MVDYNSTNTGAVIDASVDAVEAVSGDLVGTTDTQTLTNKTINTSSNTITVVAADVSDFDTEVSNNSTVTGKQDVLSEGAFVDGDKTKLDGISTGAEVNTIDSDPTGVTGADAVTNIMSLTQAEYDAIGTPNASTFYIITDA